MAIGKKGQELKNMVACEMCGTQFQMGPHVYEGKFIPRFQLSVCTGCFQGNWDGWAPHYEARLETHLRKKGIALPKRNAAGYYPRGD